MLLEPGQVAISPEAFQRLNKTYMKVAKETAMTPGITIKASRTTRRVESNEVVEVLEGPLKEPNLDVRRVKVRALRDGVVGWVTVSGNQGTIFLKDCNSRFRVVTETIMTDELQLDLGSEEPKLVIDNTRKLMEDEVVELIHSPVKEDASGLVRVRCRASSDGCVGWVTYLGNAGVVFLEPL